MVVMFGMAVMAVRELVPSGHTREAPFEVARLLALPRTGKVTLLAFVVLWLAYPWLLSLAGFLVATTLATAVSMWLLGVKRIGLAIAGSALFSICLAILFSTVFYIPTPSGFLDIALAKLLYVISK